MGEKQDQSQEPTWEATSSSSAGRTSKQSLSRDEAMELIKVASTAPCPSRSQLISQQPGLENEHNVVRTLDNTQKALTDDKILIKQGETTLNGFRNILEQHGLGKLPALSPSDVTEIGRMSIQTDKRCIETRIGRSS